MPISKIIEYCQSSKAPMRIEFYHSGILIEHPKIFFATHPSLLEKEFPAPDAIIDTIAKYHRLRHTHKLLISEYGFHLVQL